jgi:hypothetical protein
VLAISAQPLESTQVHCHFGERWCGVNQRTVEPGRNSPAAIGHQRLTTSARRHPPLMALAPVVVAPVVVKRCCTTTIRSTSPFKKAFRNAG